jgi:hypothetical protein
VTAACMSPKRQKFEKPPAMVAFSVLGGTQATNAANSPLLTFCAASFDRMPFRYTIVDLMSRCPSQLCTVRMSTPSRRWLVAKVCRLCRMRHSRHYAEFRTMPNFLPIFAI